MGMAGIESGFAGRLPAGWKLDAGWKFTALTTESRQFLRVHRQGLQKHAIITTVEKLVQLWRRHCRRRAGKWPRGLVGTGGRWLESTDGLLQRQVLPSQHAQTLLQYPRLFHLQLQLHSPHLHTATTLISRPCSRTTQICRYQKVSILDFIGAEDDGGDGDNWRIRRLVTTNTQLTGQLPFLSPNQQCQSTEGEKYHNPPTSSLQAHLEVFQLCLIRESELIPTGLFVPGCVEVLYVDSTVMAKSTAKICRDMVYFNYKTTEDSWLPWRRVVKPSDASITNVDTASCLFAHSSHNRSLRKQHSKPFNLISPEDGLV